jgi:hypothetical protein
MPVGCVIVAALECPVGVAKEPCGDVDAARWQDTSNISAAKPGINITDNFLSMVTS